MSKLNHGFYSDPVIGNASLVVLQSETRALERFEIELNVKVQNSNGGEIFYEIGASKLPKVVDLLVDPSAEVGSLALLKATANLGINNGLKLQRLRQFKADIGDIEEKSIDQAVVRDGIAKEQKRISSQIDELKAAVAEESLVACMASMSLDNSFKVVKARNRLSSIQAVHPSTNVEVVNQAVQKFKGLVAKRKEILKRTEKKIYTRWNSPTVQKNVPMSEILKLTSEKVEARKKDLELLEERIEELAQTETHHHQDQSWTPIMH